MSIDFKTYSAAVSAYVPPVDPTDIFAITGINGAQVRIYRVRVSGIASVAGSLSVALIKRSSNNSGGNPTNITGVTHDSIDPPPAAVVQTYGSNPQLGQSVGSVRSENITVPVKGSFATVSDFGFGSEDKPLILNNADEQLCVNLNGLVLPIGTSIDMDIEWAEQ